MTNHWSCVHVKFINVQILGWQNIISTDKFNDIIYRTVNSKHLIKGGWFAFCYSNKAFSDSTL